MSQRSYFTFTLGDRHFGVDVLHVREVIRRFEWTPVERAPEGAVGLFNLRGQIVPLVDLSYKMGNESPREERQGSEPCCVILKTEDECARIGAPALPLSEALGLLVDDIGEVYEGGREALDPPPANLGDAGKWLEGVIRLDGRLIMILDLKRPTLFAF